MRLVGLLYVRAAEKQKENNQVAFPGYKQVTP